MLNTVFYFILNMSLASCFVIAVLLLIRQIKPLPRRIVYPLWILAFFRLVTPFAFPTSWSLFNLTGGLVKRLVTIETVTQGVIQAPGSGELGAMNMIGAAEQYAPVEYKTEALRQFFQAASTIWVVIALAMLLTAFTLYMLTRKELKSAVHIKDDLYRSDMMVSPILLGLFRPKIILPVSLDTESEEFGMILAHENIHRKQLDNLWRLLAICITCFHWFNPLALIMLKTFLTDMELSCDETVIRKFGAEERKAYAGALLDFAEEKRMFVSTAFSRSGVKVRIVNVLNYKKLSLIGAVASAAFLLVIAIVLVSNPQM